MIINGTEYKAVMTERTPEELSGKFKRNLEEKGNPEEIDAMLAQFPSIPKKLFKYHP